MHEGSKINHPGPESQFPLFNGETEPDVEVPVAATEAENTNDDLRDQDFVPPPARDLKPSRRPVDAIPYDELPEEDQAYSNRRDTRGGPW